MRFACGTDLFYLFFIIFLLTLTATAEELLPHPKGTYRPLGVEPYLLVILYSNLKKECRTANAIADGDVGDAGDPGRTCRGARMAATGGLNGVWDRVQDQHRRQYRGRPGAGVG